MHKQKCGVCIQMPKRREFSEEQKNEIMEAEKCSSKKYETKRIMVLRLVAVDNLKSKEIAKSVGYNKATIDNIVSRYFKEGIKSMLGENRKGGNKRYLSEEECSELLKPFEEKAENGHMLVAAEIKKAYENKIGKEVPDSTIYRMIARQKWRKIMPRSKHPKSKPEEFDAYKKNH
jgi:transposase